MAIVLIFFKFFVGSNLKQTNIGGQRAVQSRVKKVIDITAIGVGKRKEIA